MTACNTKGALAYIACEEHTNTYTAYKYRFRGTNDWVHGVGSHWKSSRSAEEPTPVDLLNDGSAYRSGATVFLQGRRHWRWGDVGTLRCKWLSVTPQRKETHEQALPPESQPLSAMADSGQSALGVRRPGRETCPQVPISLVRPGRLRCWEEGLVLCRMVPRTTMSAWGPFCGTCPWCRQPTTSLCFFVIHVLLIHHDNMHGIKSDALKRRQNLLEGAEHFGWRCIGSDA